MCALVISFIVCITTGGVRTVELCFMNKTKISPKKMRWK